MESIRKHLQQAYALIGNISVCGDDVDRMAVARQELRQAAAELEQMKEKEEGDGQAD